MMTPAPPWAPAGWQRMPRDTMGAHASWGMQRWQAATGMNRLWARGSKRGLPEGGTPMLLLPPLSSLLLLPLPSLLPLLLPLPLPSLLLLLPPLPLLLSLPLPSFLLLLPPLPLLPSRRRVLELAPAASSSPSCCTCCCCCCTESPVLQGRHLGAPGLG